MATILCLTCEFGLVREYDCEAEECETRHFINKCLKGNDYAGNVITSCNKYSGMKTKVTYHDPDFDEYEKAIEKGEETHAVVWEKVAKE